MQQVITLSAKFNNLTLVAKVKRRLRLNQNAGFARSVVLSNLPIYNKVITYLDKFNNFTLTVKVI